MFFLLLRLLPSIEITVTEEGNSLQQIEVLNLSYNRIKLKGLEIAMGIAHFINPNSKIYLTGNLVQKDEDKQALDEYLRKISIKKQNFGDEFIHRDTNEHTACLEAVSGDKIVYGDRDMALPLICSEKYDFPTNIQPRLVQNPKKSLKTFMI